MALDVFTPRVAAWFARAFDRPTAVQEQAWPLIASGEHVVISAPTGSGKTLAAFLYGLDRLAAHPLPQEQKRVRLLYVSPLKALSHDVDRNLRAPLRGILGPSAAGTDDPTDALSGETDPLPPDAITVALRTGDTPQRDRAAMRRRPPDILITTPESLFLMLTSGAREILSGVETVIVDEIHAVAGTKRGSHLALTLERLSALRAASTADRPGAWTGEEIQRIGLSATQNPLEEIGRFLVGPRRRCAVVETGEKKRMDIRIQVPVESMITPDSAADPLEPVVGGESTRNSIWPAMYPQILDLVQEHRSTIVFVNSRRSAERLALRLNELAEQRLADAEDAAADGRVGARDADGRGAPASGERDVDAGGGVAGSHTRVVGAPSTGPHAVEIARAHHGSLSREEREVVEELLKAGKLPCLVATSSLELGIDMGAVDLVLQVESPKSVAAGLQRIGRAGHGVGETAKGRIFPKFRADLLECAVVVQRMRAGQIEPTVVPKNPLDVLAQQIVAIAASAGPPPGGAAAKAKGPPGDAASKAKDAPAVDEDPGVPVDELFALITRTHTYAELSRELLERTLDMLDGRYPSQDFAELRPRIVWDRVGGTIRPRRGAGRLAIANAGTIPDRGLYRVVLPDGRRVGELDEEMVYEARAGQTFLLGASTWRIEEIGRDKVVVTPAPGAPGAVPFWRGDQRGRPKELGEAIGAFSRWAVVQDEATLAADCDLDPLAARNLLDFLLEQQDATGVLPSDRTIVLERFKDEIGDWRICLLSPFGGRVHAAWGLAASRQIREELGQEADAIWSDDGIILHLPDVDDEDEQGWARIVELLVPEPDAVEDLIVAELGTSALFGARFRENAGRALLIPRARPGQRTPLWQQRLKAQSLLQVAQEFPDFPIILETYRECLRDVLDVTGLVEILTRLAQQQITLTEVQTPTASPMAGSLLFDYIATYMYEGDAPNAERRAAALSLDRDLLRELLGQDELRELLDEGALAQLEADLQHRSERTRAQSPDALAEVLRRVGDLTLAEVAERVALSPGDGDARVGEDSGAAATSPDPERLALAQEWLTVLERQRRTITMRIGGEERWIAADDAGLYRDALGAIPPGGLPEVFLGDVVDPLRRLVVRYAATHGPFVDHQVRARYGVDVAAVLRELLREDALVRGEMRPGGTETEHCDPEVLRRLRRMSLAVLRQEIEPVDPRALVPFSLGWQGVDRYPADRRDPRPPDRLRETLVPLQGLALPVALWESEVLPRRLGGYDPAWLDGLCASGEVVWVGAGGLGSRSSRGRVALYFRDDAAVIGPPMLRAVREGSSAPSGDSGSGSRGKAGGPGSGGPRGDGVADGPGPAAPAGARGDDESGPLGPVHDALRTLLAQRPVFFAEMLEALPEHATHLRDALWDLIWAGEVTCDVFAPLRAGRAGMKTSASPVAPPRRGRRRFGPRATVNAQAATQGRFSLVGPLFAPSVGEPPMDPGLRRRTLAELLLERHGIVTREHVRAEGIVGGFATLYDSFGALETLGVCRRGYFVEGLGGAQFALPGAVERLRAQTLTEASGAPSALDAAGRPLPATTLDATDPAQPYGSLLRWPTVEVDAQRPPDANPPRPQRSTGAQVVLVGPDPILFCDRSGKALQVLVAYEDPRLPVALATLVEAVTAGRVGSLPRKGLQLERIDGLPVIGHPLEPLLPAAGFRSSPTRYLARA